ncbi:amine GPCR [Clonorchis sinensis]|uniref:Amine GPCR n=1 Tax=Clonorchis sinensis TaxID=79923 RepID=H2KVV1_CLOSI|nr:amine GPCR [Clonorchis sinensis]
MSQPKLVVRLLTSNLGFVGTILNIIQLYVLCQCKIGSRLTTVLLRGQSVIDAYTCLVVFLSRLVGTDITTGVPFLDAVLCYVWRGDNMFWLGIALSVQNLTCISFDRFCAVCFPRQYKVRQTLLIIGCYLYEVGIVLFLFIPSFLATRFTSNKCLLEFAIPGVTLEQFFRAQAFLLLIFNYILPAFIMIGSHVYVIHVIRHPAPGQQSNQHIGNTIKRLALTTAMMAGLLLVLHPYEIVRYILATSNVIHEKSDSVTRQIGSMFVILGAVLNPFVLIALSYTVRRQVVRSVLHYDAIKNAMYDTNETADS